MTRLARPTLRARAEAACPEGVIWLPPDTALHPEGRAPIPFVFAVGRIEGPDGRKHGVREIELVLGAGDGRDDADRLAAYARHVLRTAPGQHARLSGRALAALEAAGDRRS